MKVISIKEENGIVTLSTSSVNTYVNSNRKYNNTFYYTNSYIKINKDKVSSILDAKIIKQVIVKDADAFLIISPFLTYSNIKFIEEKSLSEKVMNKLLQNRLLKRVECYFMPSDYVHDFAKKGVSIKFNNNLLFTSMFVKENKLSSLRHIYYKKVLYFYNEKEIKENLENFLKTNTSLKLIKLFCFSKDIINFVVEKLIQYDFQDVIVFIYQNEDNTKELKEAQGLIKRLNSHYGKKDDKLIRIIYSNDFFDKNIFKELSTNVLKVCMVIVIYLGIAFVFSESYHEYVGFLNLRLLEETLATPTTNSENDIEIDEHEDVETEVIEEEEEEESEGYTNPYWYTDLPYQFDTLLGINSDTVGWISLNNTDVNYPVLQSYDNKFYLNHDIYQNWSGTGWIFMDYRNSRYDLDRNTIIYGHNLKSGLMFGTLKKTVNYSWYSNPENQIITFNTIDREMKWKIFSMYQTDNTNDYLTTDFYGDNDFMKYINMVKSRSMYDFGVEVSAQDKILTISTCSVYTNKRLAIHAVLINE